MRSDQQDRQIHVRGEIIIDGPARLIGSFSGTIAEGRIVTSGNVSIGEEADAHASIETDSVAIQPGAATLTYVPAPAPEAEAPSYQQQPVAPAPIEQAAPTPAPQAVPAPVAPPAAPTPAPPAVVFPTNQPQVPSTRQTRSDSEDNAARQARARLAAYSRKAATGTDDPSGWASS